MAENHPDKLLKTDYSITFTYANGAKLNPVKNTWTDWHLIPTSKPMFTQPNPIYKFIDIPGVDGQFDLTDYLIGRPTYSNRSGSFEFYLANGYDKTSHEMDKELANFFRGSFMKCYLGYNSQYIYHGRFFYRGMTPEANRNRITIDYQVKPYRYIITNNQEQEAGL